jgi:hypothetical protein
MLRRIVAAFAVTWVSTGALLAAPKLDKETCDQLKTEQATFAASGIAADFEKGPVWANANLAPDRLRELEHYILLDEQLKFGCRQATISIDALRAGEEATKLEAKPNLDIPDKDDDKDKALGAADGAKANGDQRTETKADEKKPARKPHRDAGGENRAAAERPKTLDASAQPPTAPETSPATDKRLTDEP